ncbi:MAG: T9SS type A sorting domain-containing protein [Bacteroidetes bacterium]|nr:T9SS type A sorting domain-containing protein [Bacteroidota bacterium]
MGTRTAGTSGGSTFVIPYTTATSAAYRVRVLASNPTFTSQSNGVDLAITGLSISTPTLPNTFFCQGEVFNCSYTQSCNFAAGNSYSVQLSDASGSFASPITIGTRSATTAAAISCTIPAITAAGAGYRIRIISSNPSLISPDNGYNVLVNAYSGTPSVAGNGFWNAYCYNTPNNYVTNYEGYFTENNMSFDTRVRYTSTLCPSTTSASANGNAYAGCTFTNTNNYSVALKRTNIPCGYYDFSIVGHDDAGSILIDGVTVYSNPYIGGVAVPNAYRAFISPTNTVEVRYSNTGAGPGYMAINITTVNIINAYNPATICAGTTTTLSATNTSTVPLAFSWAPTTFASPTTGSLTTVSPTVTTIFTVSATDATSGCAASNTVQITVNPVATTTIAATSTIMCSGITQVTLTAGGAASYTWSPSAGLSSVNGTSVVANPTVTTTYTVSGSNNCNTVDASTLITVQSIPSSPTPTVYGTSAWNVYCYNDQTFSNYYGYYTENNLNFATTSRWNSTNGPSSCTTTATGLAYQGCNITPTSWSMRFRRTNITCGYYQIDISSKDDNLKLYIDGVLVASGGCCGAQTNFWTGFIGSTTLVEFTLVNTGGPGNMGASFTSVPYPFTGPPITICAGGPATITATPFISTATYSWTPNIGLSSTTGTAVVISPTANIVYTVTVSDPVTTCSSSATQTVNVNPLPTTTVSPTTGTIACAVQSVTLNAGGAYTYSWSPAAGLSATSGVSVVATPTITTTYTVTGSNVCANVDATSTITVIPLVAPTVFPTNVWNVYCHNNTTFNNYYGYYTHIGTGTTGYDFNTATQWASGAAPSTATANASGTAYQGCTMSASNISLSFKRTNFACGTYTITLNNNDDGVALLIDGVQVANRAANSAVSVTFWTGVLNSNSQVEFKLNQGGGGSGLKVTFTAAAATASLSTWVGGTSTDWFTASNWCGSGVPTLSTDVFIPNSKPQFMPVINAAGAACRSLTISALSASTAVTSALPAASLTINGSNSLDVYGNWINNGDFSAGNGVVNILGIFPLGAGSFYRPISISAPGVSTDHFTAQYFLTDASPSYTHTSKDATIDHIGRCEYWILNRTGGSSNVSVSLTWNTTSCGVTNLSDLLVARWDAGQAKWKDEGNGGTSGNTTAGTIVTAAPVTLFSPFTLASRTSSNPLPIELTSFGCSLINKNTIGLSWTTASEANNNYFGIERSADGVNFEQIAKQNGAGNSLVTLNYNYSDPNPLKGISYYRLKQVDFNGKYTYSSICSVTNNGDGGVAFYPNPVKNTLTIDYEFSEKPKANIITVTDVTGKLITVPSTFSNSNMILDCSDLSEGIYFLKVLVGDKEVINKFTVQK